MLSQQGIETGIHYPMPLHLQSAYSHLGYKEGDFPISETCAQTVLSLPLYPELSEVHQKKIVQVIRGVITEPANMVMTGGVIN